MIIKRDPLNFQSYLEDSSNLKGGHARYVVIPQNAPEISSVLKDANSKKTPVTISGAGTGQAGARIAFGGLVLSTEKLNAIKDIKKFDEGGYAVLEPGVLIKDLKEACGKKGLFYTYDPTEQTAFVGGTIATNASGARSFRYGSTRQCVKALKVILADGAILSLRRGGIKAKGRLLEFEVNQKHYKINLPTYKMPRTKNSAGYYAEDNMDIVDLFIGQEGTLGVIVEAELKLLEKPKEFFTCFAFFPEEHFAWNFAQDAYNANPLSLEYLDNNCIKLLQRMYHNVPGQTKAAILFEDEIRESENAIIEKWEKLLSKHGVSLDNTWVAMNEKTHREFLDKRHYIGEQMGEMAKRSGFTKVHTDLAVPKEKLPEMLQFYKDNLSKSNLEYFIFGHIGDAHLHVNMIPSGKKEYNKARELELEFVKKSVALGGTVSAEHGIGKTKREFLKLLYGEKGIREMFAVKKALDPNLILGRGNIFHLL
ncbi:MAG: FAD-binding oxidoreductase [Candidatus Omnitrophota bacterium]|nr:MAG: FAD-binding oxidoreductase [Candidatus Omnitrophota bacterium]